MEERFEFMNAVDFNIKQKFTKAGGERMRLRANAVVTTSSGTIPVESKRDAHPAQLVATNTTPTSQGPPWEQTVDKGEKEREDVRSVGLRIRC